MNPRLENKLCEKFPDILTDTVDGQMSPFSNLMFFIGDGWFPLLYRLFRSLANEHPIKGGQFEIERIIEEHGTLHIGGYYPQWSDKLIDDAEAASEFICDVCGEAGSLRGVGWYNARCSAHEGELQMIDDAAITKMIDDISD